MDADDNYKVAAELYASSLRALEQRGMAFLLVQSLLATTYGALHCCGAENLFILKMGIALLGIAFCFLTYVSGKTVAQGVWLWQKYMEDFEAAEGDKGNGLWHKYKENGESFWLQKRCKGHLPVPTLWVISPGFFLIAWVCAILIMFNVCTCCVVLTGILILGAIIAIWRCCTKSTGKTESNKPAQQNKSKPRGELRFLIELFSLASVFAIFSIISFSMKEADRSIPFININIPYETYFTMGCVYILLSLASLVLMFFPSQAKRLGDWMECSDSKLNRVFLSTFGFLLWIAISITFIAGVADASDKLQTPWNFIAFCSGFVLYLVASSKIITSGIKKTWISKKERTPPKEC